MQRYLEQKQEIIDGTVELSYCVADEWKACIDAK